MDTLNQWAEWMPEVISGLTLSLTLTGLSLLFGMPLGLVLALLAESRSAFLKWMGLVVVEIGRGAPALVLLYLLYFGLPQVGITLAAFSTATFSLSWTTGAYASELFRAGLAAVPQGQREAAITSGLSGWTGFRHIIFPQSIRISTPPLASLAITIFQTSSLAFVVAVPELMSKAYSLGAITFQYLSIFILTALVYALITIAGLAVVRMIEQRMNRHLVY
jgi:polar amino acid transport system permease protein